MCDTFVQKLSAVFSVDSSPEITQCRWCHLFRIIFSILFLALFARSTFASQCATLFSLWPTTLCTQTTTCRLFHFSKHHHRRHFHTKILLNIRVARFLLFISILYSLGAYHNVDSAGVIGCEAANVFVVLFFCVVCWLITLHWLSMRSETDWHTACNNMAPSLYRASSYHIQLEPFFSAPESFLAHGNDSYCWLFRQLNFFHPHSHTHRNRKKNSFFVCARG